MKISSALLLVVLLFVSGCASFGRGIAEAFMKPQEKNLGECRVFSKGFDGFEDIFTRNDGKVRVLMIHGIGKKTPGYATGFVENLAFGLGLTIMNKDFKEINLLSTSEPDKDLGKLRIYRLTNINKSKELLFYEYTWASITDAVKRNLDFDMNDSNSVKRTNLSKLIKSFINETGTDAVIYLGNSRVQKQIKDGVAQSFCWMLADTWNDLPDGEKIACTSQRLPKANIMKDYLIITHSLGSQISIDSLQEIVAGKEDPMMADFVHNKYKTYAQKTQVTIYMFANQLPAIAVGKNPPTITDKIDNYCQRSGSLFQNRFLNNMNVIAFSDPNDVLSYAIPPKFEREHIDSRLCPDVSNVIVNVAPLTNLFGTPTANPLEAHSNYQNDQRVLDLIINGIHPETPQQDPDKGCYWMKTIE